MNFAKLANLHVRNMTLLRKRALEKKASDIHERRLHLEVAQQYAAIVLPPYVCAVEWDAPGGYRGDLVFCDTMGTAVVVEVKHVPPTASPESRYKRMRKVRDQAILYQSKWQVLHPRMHTLAATYTNYDGLTYLTEFDQYWV